MSKFLFRLGRSSARHPFRVLGAWLLLAVLVIGLSSQFGGQTADDWNVPGTESQAASDILLERFPDQSGWTGRIVFHVDQGRVDAGRARAAVAAAIERAEDGTDVLDVSDPFAPAFPTVSADGRTAFATIHYDSNAPKEVYGHDASDAADVARDRGVQAELSGEIATPPAAEGNEMIGLLAAVVILLVAFGSLMAMGIPIGTALVGLVVGMSGIGLMAGFTEVSTSAPMLATMIGLGVGIDYALFVVTRHRQHLAEGMAVDEAAGIANATAGQAVLFAGATVVVAILGLVMGGVPSMAIMGFACAIVVFVSMLVAVTLLPAMLGLVGTRIDKLSVHRRAVHQGLAHETFAGRWAHHIGRRPWRYALASLLVLLALAAPVTALRLGFADDSNAAPNLTQHKAYDLMAEGFGKGSNGPLVVVVERPSGDATQAAADVVQAVSADPGVALALPPMASPDGRTAVVTALPTTGPQDPDTATTVSRLRADVLPRATEGTGAKALVTGTTATYVDLSERLAARLPVFIAAVVALSFLLLLVVFRSILVPLKAALMNLLSIGAAYGVIVAVFQWGWAKDLFGVEATIPINPFVPMIMFAILFGLSMDYEVFLLSRVREEFQRTGDSHTSVVEGLSATARVITSAALIMISVFGAFVAADDVTMKMFGLGLAVAVAIDATVVRMVLVPSTMALLGNANWWLPGWLDRLLPHFDLEGGAQDVEAVSVAPVEEAAGTFPDDRTEPGADLGAASVGADRELEPVG